MYNRLNVTILKILQQTSALLLTRNKTLKNSIEWDVDAVGNILISSGYLSNRNLMRDAMSQPWAPPSCLAYQFSAEINVSSAFQRNGNEKVSKRGRITWDPDEQDKIPVLLMRIPPLSPDCGKKKTSMGKVHRQIFKPVFIETRALLTLSLNV